MERIAVFVDDAAYARRLIEPFVPAGGRPSVAWIVVACPPRLTHRIGKFLAHRSREQWRDRWAANLRAQLEADLGAPAVGQAHEWLVARGPLSELVQRLHQQHGTALRVFDARRPKLGVAQMPLTPGQEREPSPRWTTPVAVSSSLSLMLALTD